MDKGNRRFISNESTRSSASNFSHTSATSLDPWHSTPTKKATTAAGSVLEGGMVQKQRRELQLLMAELKDRDRELNDMVAAHTKQLQGWEKDRQRVLRLEQRNARLEGELQKQKEVIRALTQQLRLAEVRQRDGHMELNDVQLQLRQLSQQHQNSASRCQDLEERNESLNSTILELSSQVGQLQVHEEELSATLKLKDKDVTKATNLIVDLSGRFQKLEEVLKDYKAREAKVLKLMEQHKRGYHEAKEENAQLKDQLQEKTAESNAQKEEIIRLKQENEQLQRKLEMAGEGERWKDELMELAQSKQGRVQSPSSTACARYSPVCENQQNDLQLLQLNLESAQEALIQLESRVLPGRQGNQEASLLLDCPALLACEETAGCASDLSPPTGTNSDLSLQQLLYPQSPASDCVQGSQQSPTSCLRRLLAQSQEMVCSLERSTSCPAHSPTHNPTLSPYKGSAPSLARSLSNGAALS
ncbi:hypothetical protein AGOR_G00245640 [Albula goreensis]|uniref:Coiled-coil domain-containing protein 62 n=1 Tax=Albula goreensis TaxID=1534307 RepID=A0A8T3CDQ6_9TELE|nr:hypothetical protein AGOR_G00245640 [Albula goreensis]